MRLLLLNSLVHAFSINRKLRLDFSKFDEYTISSTPPSNTQQQSFHQRFMDVELQLELTGFQQLSDEFIRDIEQISNDGIGSVFDHLSNFLDLLTKICKIIGIDKLNFQQDCVRKIPVLTLESFIDMLKATKRYLTFSKTISEAVVKKFTKQCKSGCIDPDTSEETRQVCECTNEFKQHMGKQIFHILALIEYFKKHYESYSEADNDVFD
ncbi:uncharacterized protein VICG_01461 [Vittaforma corneae ATCC 50505]|uniref:Uncharacterized protein n=1 Tax=Vittaforma corneae (strain ATCC 50505) TaxID=993615 RepID=L2GMF7_VITCO|nr:uncharacterized protein VICG_01461 [Vittaforma corneae ATCC 50505]ELA41477.1 hypothetical protein VICG_01461 [Vittaforma corneae ATCC 50505]